MSTVFEISRLKQKFNNKKLLEIIQSEIQILAGISKIKDGEV